MNNTKVFTTLYNRLNPAQKQAVDAIDGPVMVVAGPGTGKTQILTLRIANILRKTDTRPENILALTFTESGVIAMRRRLADSIGSPAYAVTISTFHRFCNDIIQQYPENFPRIIGSQHITEIDQIQILEDMITQLSLKELKPFGDTFYYIRPILSAIRDLKTEGVGVQAFAKMAQEEASALENAPDRVHETGPHAGKVKAVWQKLEKRSARNKELAQVYAEYEQHLAAERLYDYSDMIMEALQALKTHKELLLVLQEQYQYLLVDEHQDTNNAQNNILELLASFHASPNIFVVGDEKQAIFRFQGASLENFLYFQKLYPKAKLITLEENYRSSQAILDSAESVLQSKKKLVAKAKHPAKHIELFAFSRPEVEHFFLAHDIQAKLSEGVAPEDIAVLYRDNNDALPLARMLEKVGIPFAIESDQDVLDDPDIQKLIVLLRAVRHFGSEAECVQAMHIDFLGVDPLDLYRIVVYSKEKVQTVPECIHSPAVLKKLRLKKPKTVLAFYHLLSKLATLSHNRELTDFFETAIRESGMLSHVLTLPDSIEKLDKLTLLFEEVKSLVERHREYRLEEFIAYIDLLRTHRVLVKKSSAARKVHRVRLMTAHKSKGQEFGYVYLSGVADGHWGNKRAPKLITLPSRAYSLTGRALEERDTNDDERRLFYVALTRAKQEAIISFAHENTSGREQLPSQFILEIRPELIATKDVRPWEEQFAHTKEALFAPSKTFGASVKEKEFVKDLFIKQGLSVTGLNSYLECPWRYFYTNLLRVPQAKSKHQMYGTAIHAALRDMFRVMKERTPDKAFLLASFADAITKQPFSKADFEETLARGTEALSGYFNRYHETWRPNVLTEFNVAGVLLTPEIRLTGKIDKMEFAGSGNTVNVVDYKTGKPKSRAAIEGTIKSSDGDIKRQLVFYQTLLNLFEKGRYRMVSGDIDFIEPDARGQYHKEHFEVSEEEIAELEKLIKNISGEILSLAFWDRTCDDKDCEYCKLRKMMK